MHRIGFVSLIFLSILGLFIWVAQIVSAETPTHTQAELSRTSALQLTASQTITELVPLHDTEGQSYIRFVPASPNGIDPAQRSATWCGDTTCPLRVHFDMGDLSTLSGTTQDRLQNKLIDEITTYISKTLNIIPTNETWFLDRFCLSYYNVDGDIRCVAFAPVPEINGTLATTNADWYADYRLCTGSSLSSCTIQTGGTGVTNTDIVIQVTAGTVGCGTSTLAYAGSSKYDTDTGRPILGFINICPNADNSDYASLLSTMNHEVLHALGFSHSLMDNWVDESHTVLGLANVISTTTYNGSSANLLITPNVLAKAREHFGCATLDGVALEDDGGVGTANSHFEERLFFSDLMTGIIYQPFMTGFSELDLALLEDTGWYVPNYEHGEPLLFNEGAGCQVPVASCTELIAEAPQTYCDTDFVQGALFDGRARGFCGTATSGFTFTDGCGIIYPYSNGDCGVGESAFVYTSGVTSYTTCLPATCDAAGTSLDVTVSGTTYQCDANATISAGPYSALHCPSDVTMQAYCPAERREHALECGMRGVLRDGACQCAPGFTGSRCQTSCDEEGAACGSTQALCYASPDDGFSIYTTEDARAIGYALDNLGLGSGTIGVGGVCTGIEVRESVTQTVYISADLTLQGGFVPTITESAWQAGEPSTTLDANDAGTVVRVPTGVTATIRDLTITNGSAISGAGVDNAGDLALIDVILQNNDATGSGGAVANRDGGTLQVVRGVVSGNSAENGAAIANLQTEAITSSIVISNSALISNTVTQRGGAIYNEVLSTTTNSVPVGNVTIIQSTLSGNRATIAGGAVANLIDAVAANAPLNLLHTTIANNTAPVGAGVWHQATAGSIAPTLAHTIIADNQVGNDCYISQSLTNNAPTLDSDESCGATLTYDNPLLAALADNGGNTWTHELRSGSPAINAGDITFVATDTNDQRGSDYQRIANARLDLGAYETQALTTQILPDMVTILEYQTRGGTIMTVSVPVAAVDNSTTLRYELISTPTDLPKTYVSTEYAFELDTVDDGLTRKSTPLQKPVLMTFEYNDTLLQGASENDLRLYYYDDVGTEWVDAAASCTPNSAYVRDKIGSKMSIEVCELNEFGVFLNNVQSVPTSVGLVSVAASETSPLLILFILLLLTLLAFRKKRIS